MAIQFARMRYVGRKAGGNAVRTACYNARLRARDERTGELFDFTPREYKRYDRTEVLHHEVMLPEGADLRFSDCIYLANAEEAAERRIDSQVFRELLLALPADAELNLQDRITLARTFLQEHFVDKGVAVQLDIHSAHGDKNTSEPSLNVHAHAKIGVRRIEGERLSSIKAKDLDPIILTSTKGKSFVKSGELWGTLWKDHQERYFEQQKLEITVDAIAPIVDRTSIGPVRMRRRDANRRIEFKERRRLVNAEYVRDSEATFEHLRATRQKLDARSLTRFLSKFLDNDNEIEQIRAAVMQLRRVERERPMKEDSTSGLYERYKEERGIASVARNAAVQEVYDRFASYQHDLRGYYNLRHEQEKLGARRGSERHAGHEILKAERSASRVEAQMLRQQQLAAARRDHPLPDWGSWLKQQAERGDPEAAKVLASKLTREMDHERGG